MKKNEISFAIAAICAILATAGFSCVTNINADPHAAWMVLLFVLAGASLFWFGLSFLALSVWEYIAPGNFFKTMKKLSETKKNISDKLMNRICDFLIEEK